ncbi:MAG: hypothetical protein U0Z75_09480 [Deinococcaceae bacterium]
MLFGMVWIGVVAAEDQGSGTTVATPTPQQIALPIPSGPIGTTNWHDGSGTGQPEKCSDC